MEKRAQAALYLVGAALTIAATTTSAAETVIREIVVVEAPIKVSHQRRADDPVMRTETVELSREVSFSDLDLTKHADVQTLRDRVRETARQSCETLKDLFPMPPTGPSEVDKCVERALQDAEDGIEAAIASVGE